MDPGSVWRRDFLGRVLIVAVFSHAASISVLAIAQQIAKGWPPNSLESGLQLAAGFSNFAFLIMVVAMTVARRTPVRSASGLEPRVTALLGTYALFLLPAVSPGVPASPALAIAGFILLFVGFLLSAYVISWLGRSFSIMPEARKLVSKGPYAIVRHPLYVTEEIAVLGILSLNLSLWTGILVAVHWLLQLRRMHNEEIVLRAEFPDYGQYAIRTPKFFPRWPFSMAGTAD